MVNGTRVFFTLITYCGATRALLFQAYTHRRTGVKILHNYGPAAKGMGVKERRAGEEAKERERERERGGGRNGPGYKFT